ncbi:MAG: hypothetical protein Q9221_008772 [Calogaya cf. arnoldii]
MKEGRLLRFMRTFNKQPFHLIIDGGMPVAVPPEQTYEGAKMLSDQDYTGEGGLAEAITAVLGVGGIMFEEDAQRYIAEFKSQPSQHSAAQLVYAGFRFGSGPSTYGNVRCYGE